MNRPDYHAIAAMEREIYGEVLTEMPGPPHQIPAAPRQLPDPDVCRGTWPDKGTPCLRQLVNSKGELDSLTGKCPMLGDPRHNVTPPPSQADPELITYIEQEE